MGLRLGILGSAGLQRPPAWRQTRATEVSRSDSAVASTPDTAPRALGAMSGAASRGPGHQREAWPGRGGGAAGGGPQAEQVPELRNCRTLLSLLLLSVLSPLHYYLTASGPPMLPCPATQALGQETWQGSLRRAGWRFLLKPLTCCVALGKILPLSGHLFLPAQHSALNILPTGTRLEGRGLTRQPGEGGLGMEHRLGLCPLPQEQGPALQG